MEVDQLTDEKPTGAVLEGDVTQGNSTGKRMESGNGQQVPENSGNEEPPAEAGERALKGAEATRSGASDPIILNKSGKGVIPYERHKALRVENSALREQLQSARSRLDELQKQENGAESKRNPVSDDALIKHMDVLKNDMPELHQVISTILEGSRRQDERLEEALQTLRSEQEESKRVRELSVQEQVAEARDNNPDLVHWEASDSDAWDEALRQDEILRTTSVWAGRPYAERFEEVVRRVRAIMPEASAPSAKADPEQTKAHAKARLEAATPRKPITLSDIQGGANPASEREQIENLSPHELAKKLMQMPSHKAAALRAELD